MANSTMDGFVVVQLVSNNTYNGSEASLKASEINNTYVFRLNENPWEAPTAPDPSYKPFYGLWAWLLFSSVLALPLVAWLVCYGKKLLVDKQGCAQLDRQLTPTPPPQRDDNGFELQEINGRNPANPNPYPPAPQPRAATRTQIAVIVFFLIIWRCTALAISLQRIVFVVTLLPWLQSPECMRDRFGTVTPTQWPWWIIVPGLYIVLFHVVLMVLCIMVGIATMRMRHRTIRFIDPFSKDDQLTVLYLKLYLCAWVEVLVFVLIISVHDYDICTHIDRLKDLHWLMASYLPGIIWMVIDRASRRTLKGYLTTFGFPRFPPGSEDVHSLS